MFHLRFVTFNTSPPALVIQLDQLSFCCWSSKRIPSLRPSLSSGSGTIFPQTLAQLTSLQVTHRLDGPYSEAFLGTPLTCFSQLLLHAQLVFFGALITDGTPCTFIGSNLTPALDSDLSQQRLHCLVHSCILS